MTSKPGAQFLQQGGKVFAAVAHQQVVTAAGMAGAGHASLRAEYDDRKYPCATPSATRVRAQVATPSLSNAPEAMPRG